MNQKILNILYGIIIAALIGTVAYLAIGRKSETADNQQPAPVAAPTNPTTNWKLYRSDAYGFEIKYPNDLLKLTEDATPQSGNIFSLNLDAIKQKELENQNFPAFSISLTIINNQSEADYFSKQAEYLSNPNNEARNTWKIINVAGKKWVEVWGFPGLYGHFNLITPHNARLYQFGLSALSLENMEIVPQDADAAEGLKIFNQILSTLKFTK